MAGGDPDKWPEVQISLYEQCLDVCVRNPDPALATWKCKQGYALHPQTTLTVQICDSLAQHAKNTLTASKYIDFLSLFRDCNRTRLKRIDVSGTEVIDEDIQYLLAHEPTELNIDDCHCLHGATIIDIINRNSRNMTKLFIGNTVKLFNRFQISGHDPNNFSVFKCPNLRAFSIRELRMIDQRDRSAIDIQVLIPAMLRPMKNLVYLDISCCEIDTDSMACLKQLTNLTSLILYAVHLDNPEEVFNIIGNLSNLRQLDLSQNKDTDPVVYNDIVVNFSMKSLVGRLPHLTWLDLSGTNLAGFVKPKQVDHRPEPNKTVQEDDDFPFLCGRRLKFLGLLKCAYEACERENIPADKVTGDANELQIIQAVQTYVEKAELAIKALNDLFQIFKHSHCNDQKGALQGILNCMRRHPYDKHIQISGSASLFYIVKGECKDRFNTFYIRQIVMCILVAMENHADEFTMMRNGCLTLCHLSIPRDVMFEYKRLVKLLLDMVQNPRQEEFVQRIGIYLLNSLACQVDGKEKHAVGQLGAIEVMLSLIRGRYNDDNCDEVMEIAWSTMWNVTDETPSNCKKFIDEDGMTIFLDCLEKFDEKEELLRNMMGLLGNVAEVADLRPRLMESEFVGVFKKLLESKSDGIEVSYNACGVLAHIVSDGPDAWTIGKPSREEVLRSMVNAINSWNLKTKRNINYRSFEPILRLIPNHTTPEAQHWAVWALCNLSKMYRKKYCPLIEEEGGVEMLRDLSTDPRPYEKIRMLTREVLRRIKIFKEDPAYDSADEIMRSDDEEDMIED